MAKLAYGYCRISKKGNNVISMEAQEQSIRSYCLEHNYHLFKVYSEISSAYKEKPRRKFQRMLKEIEPDSIIIVNSVCRFSRNTLETANIINKLSKKNIYVYSIMNCCSTDNPAGLNEIMKNACNAQYYSDALSDKMKKSIQFRKLQGHYMGGTPPYGWNILKVNGIRKLFRNEEEFKIIKFILELHEKKTKLKLIVAEVKKEFDLTLSEYLVNKVIKKYSVQGMVNGLTNLML